jgi:AcrR family transcriptional regulator
MSQKIELPEKDPTTEEKIKIAARKVFQKKGYAGTKTRDIAEEAGVNLALLNYYYRSKEKLYNLIMEETLQLFFRSMKGLINNQNSSLEDKLNDLADNYINLLNDQPDLPIFILNEIQSNPRGLSERMGLNQVVLGSHLLFQFKNDLSNNAVPDAVILQIIINTIGMLVFPYVAKPMLKEIFNISDEQFKEMMLLRKKMVPIWIQSMFSNSLNYSNFTPSIQNIKL